MSRLLVIRVELDTVGAEFPRSCAEAIEAGFDGVEAPLRVMNGVGGSTRPSITTVPDRGDPSVPHGTIAALFAALGENEAEAARGRVAGWLELAGSLGARCLSIELPETPGEPAKRDGRDGELLNLAYTLLHGLRFEAERTGVALALEAATGGAFTSAIELRDLIDAANSWAVGVCVDVRRLAGLARPEDWIRALGRRIHAVRIPFTPRDGAGGSPGSEAEPAAAFDHPAIVSALGDVNYGGIVIATGHASPEVLLREVRRCGYLGA